MANSCFALKNGKERPAYHAAQKKKINVLKIFFHKIPFGEGSNLIEDEFEQPTLLQQVLKPYPVSSFLLFHSPIHMAEDDQAIKQPAAKTNFSERLIYNLLYPKHFFR